MEVSVAAAAAAEAAAVPASFEIGIFISTIFGSDMTLSKTWFSR